ncbi:MULTISPECIES: PspC domain-containing protein [Myroides]|uniref:PspC domain-containing protein n=1 Tax=Myroides albus TaxID=2562892 RepID=A0A6I3LKS2_9FLAO|nr:MULTISPECIES: PspC domain-containing protein [Myroides]MTG99218.1 PspC domain-containing protein [Myroides albus]MVX36192.1 PspC domain-containing protein [Myroides sp. LoEW2-1]UVD78676.1 PspC domain-containing protein [Myroides albus]
MNKTLTINIAGLVFHIDENAYQKLDSYLKAIKNSLLKEEQDEIIHDIEIRIAELFSENISDKNQVITIADVDTVINIMGKPEDYNYGEEETTSENHYTFTTSKKLYRDSKKGILGGVLAGLSHYLRIDLLWLRIIFLILVLFYGTGILLYFIFWIVVPKAKTTSQILEMEREPININTIEKKVKDNINYVANKISEVDYDKIKTETEKVGQKSAKWFKNLFGVFIIALSSTILFAIIVAGITTYVNKETIIREGIANHIPFFNDAMFSFTLSTLLVFMIAALPFIGLLLIGLRLIYTNIRYVFATLLGLFIVWLIAIVAFALPFLKMENYNSYYTSEKTAQIAEVSNKINIDFPQTEVLNITLVKPSFFESDNAEIIQHLSEKNIVQVPITFEIIPSFQEYIYIKIEGDFSKTVSTKNKTLVNTPEIEQIQTKKIQDNLIISDTYLSDESKQLKLYIYLPIGKSVYIDNKTRELLGNEKELFKPNHIYQMKENKVMECIDC